MITYELPAKINGKKMIITLQLPPEADVTNLHNRYYDNKSGQLLQQRIVWSEAVQDGDDLCGTFEGRHVDVVCSCDETWSFYYKNVLEKSKIPTRDDAIAYAKKFLETWE